MIKRFSLLAVCLAAVSALGARAEATYTVSTSISGVTVSGAPVTVTPSPFSFTVGGTATLTLTDFPATVIPDSNFSIPRELVALSGSFSGSAAISVSELISINGTGAFTEVATYNLLSGGLVNTSVSFSGPTSVSIGGTLYTATQPLATSVEFGSNGAISAIVTPTAVPEPASIAMLGLGLAGVGAYGLRRRRAAK